MPQIGSRSPRKLPLWYQDAKLGIIIHWGLYSVPAWAPKTGRLEDVIRSSGWQTWFKENPYAEWYQNTIRVGGSSSQKHHIRELGKGFGYEEFAPEFLRGVRKWDPSRWAELAAQAGARYLVFTAKHHDGFLLWNSSHPNPHKSGYQVSRDVVGELAGELKKRKIKLGLYYSGSLDWTYQQEPILDFSDMFTNAPQAAEYAGLVMDHYNELIERYRPAVLWNDIDLPAGIDLHGLVDGYREQVEDGVINDRFVQVPVGTPSSIQRRIVQSMLARAGKALERGETKRTAAPMSVPPDFRTAENWNLKEPSRQKWEAVCTLGTSFGYNREEKEADLRTPEELIHLLADVVSKNGNLLINIGPRADGTVPEMQRRRLLALGAWLQVNGEAIFGSRPCIRAEGGTSDGIPVRFTRKGYSLYAILLGMPSGSEIELEDVQLRSSASVALVGFPKRLKWEQKGKNLRVVLPNAIPAAPAVTLKMQLIPEMGKQKSVEHKER